MSSWSNSIRSLLTDEEYRQLQAELVRRPEVGAVVPGNDGLRKVRWSMLGHGKRGGARVIYYWAVKQDQLLIYSCIPRMSKTT